MFQELLAQEAGRARAGPTAAPASSPKRDSPLGPSFDAWLHAKLHQGYLALRERLASFDPDGRGLVLFNSYSVASKQTQSVSFSV